MVQRVQLASLDLGAGLATRDIQVTPATRAVAEALEQLDLKVRKVFVEILEGKECGER